MPLVFSSVFRFSVNLYREWTFDGSSRILIQGNLQDHALPENKNRDNTFFVKWKVFVIYNRSFVSVNSFFSSLSSSFLSYWPCVWMGPLRGVIGRSLHPSGSGKSWFLVVHSLEFTFGFVILSIGKYCSFCEKLKMCDCVFSFISIWIKLLGTIAKTCIFTSTRRIKHITIERQISVCSRVLTSVSKVSSLASELGQVMLKHALSGCQMWHDRCLPFVRINRLGWQLNNGKGFSKISKPTEWDSAYHL